MNFKSFISSVSLSVGIILCLSSCDNSHELEGSPISDSMKDDLANSFYTTDRTPFSATVSYDCSIPTGMDFIEIGIEYKKESYSWHKAEGSYSEGKVTVNLSGLDHSTKYTIRAYVISKDNVCMTGSKTDEFSTLSMAKLKLEDVVDYSTSSSSARVHFTTSSDIKVSELGYCISEKHNPTISNAQKSRNNIFSFYDFSYVDKGKFYYARAYAKDDQGNVYYSDEVEFNTIAITNPLSITNAKKQSKTVDGITYNYHYTANYSFSYYGDNLSKISFYLETYGDRYWTYTTTGQKSNSADLKSVNNPSPLQYYAYATLKDGTKVTGMIKYCSISF